MIECIQLQWPNVNFPGHVRQSCGAQRKRVAAKRARECDHAFALKCKCLCDLQCKLDRKVRVPRTTLLELYSMISCLLGMIAFALMSLFWDICRSFEASRLLVSVVLLFGRRSAMEHSCRNAQYAASALLMLPLALVWDKLLSFLKHGCPEACAWNTSTGWGTLLTMARRRCVQRVPAEALSHTNAHIYMCVYRRTYGPGRSRLHQASSATFLLSASFAGALATPKAVSKRRRRPRHARLVCVC